MTIDFKKAKSIPLGLDEYQVKAYETEQPHDNATPPLAFPLLGLFGETGTLLSAIKKNQRDGPSYVGYQEAVIEELGDALWYLSDIASKKSIKLSHLARTICGTRPSRDTQKKWRFADLQLKGRRHASLESKAFEAAAIELASSVGQLVNDFKLKRIDGNSDLLTSHLVKIFRSMIRVADRPEIDLNTVAASNLQKIYSRWPKKKHFPPLFDAMCDSWEQLPRKMKMTILERKAGERVYVVQQRNGINIGSQINDNKMEEDDYRFHDAFHLSYMAILGWSPVLRALFKLKRKGVPGKDDAEDGARAIAMEEGISTLIFQRSLRLKLFDGIQSLDYSLLKLIPDLVQGYEVAACPPWQWELAILEGFKIFRELRKHRGGVVSVDLNKRSITFAKLSKRTSQTPIVHTRVRPQKS